MDCNTLIEEAKRAAEKWAEKHPIIEIEELGADWMVSDLIRAMTELLARAETAENERDAAQAIIAQDVGVTGVDAIKTCFGYPLEKVQELVEADKAGKCVVLPIKPGDEVYYIGWSVCSQEWDDPEECSGCGYECDSKRVVKSMKVDRYSWIVENFIDRENHYYYTSYHDAEAALNGETYGKD